MKPALVMDARAADHLNLIAARLSQGSFALGGAVWDYTLTPSEGMPLLPSPCVVLTAHWAASSLRLLAPPGLPSLLYAHRFPDAALAVLPPQVALAGMELAWGELAARVAALSGSMPTLVAVDTFEELPALAGSLAFSLTLRSHAAADALTAVLALDHGALELLATLARAAPSPLVRRDPDTPVRLRLDLGSLRLTVRDLRSVRPGDILFPDNAVDPDEPQLWLRCGDRHMLRGRLMRGAIAVDTPMEKMTMSNNDHDYEYDSTCVDAGLDDIEVRLSFDLGHQTLSLGALAALRPGHVFTLDGPPTRLIALRVGGSRIGLGELIAVDERIGVRVLSLGRQEASGEEMS